MESHNSISDRIENTIYGFFKFIAFLIMTVFSGIFLPHTLGKADYFKKLNRIKPFTLLAIGSFLYAIILGPRIMYTKTEMESSILSGLAVFPDYQELSIEIYREIITTDIWNVILRGFPILIISITCVYIVSLLILKKSIRFQGLKVLVNGIAIQLICITFTHLIFILSSSSLFSFYSIIPQPLYVFFTYYFTYYIFLIPLIAFGYWYYKQVDKSKVQLAVRLLIILFVSVGIIGSLPKVSQINQTIFSSPKQEFYVELKLYDHLILQRNQYDDQEELFSIPITISNKTDSTIFFNPIYTIISINESSQNEDIDDYSHMGYLQDLHYLRTKEPVDDLIMIEPNSIESYRMLFSLYNYNSFAGTFDLFAPWRESGDILIVEEYLNDEFIEIKIVLNSLTPLPYEAKETINSILIE